MSTIPPPLPPAFGLSTEDFIRYHRRACAYSRYRVADAGSRVYDEGDHQKIEEYDPHRMLLELRAEIADAISYLVGMDLVIGRWQERIEEIDA